MKKKSSKKSPVAIYKKKSEIIYNTTKVQKTINAVISTQRRVLQPSNKDNVFSDYSIESHHNKCPFDSPSSIDFNFDTSAIFSNMRKQNANISQQTYDKSFTCNKENVTHTQNVVKSSNTKMCDASDINVFDNLTFTPLKSLPTKCDKLQKGPKIIVSLYSESDFDDSLDIKTSNKENETHSIISVMSPQNNKWLIDNHHAHLDNEIHETPAMPSKKIPNTSSPKELNSPNFSINTEFSRISDLSFLPQRFSTERKGLPKVNNETHEIIDDLHMNAKPSSDTYTKYSPNTPLDQQVYLENKPPHFFLKDQHPKMCRQALFREFQHQREMSLDKNYFQAHENNIWQNDLRHDLHSPPRSITPPLKSIPEESTQFSETQILDNTDKQMNTFTIKDRTFDKERTSMTINNRQSWSKRAVIKTVPDLWKVPVSLPKKSLKPKANIKSRDSLMSNTTFDNSKTTNLSVCQVENVYSQSLTVDPFLSSTYFYDEEAVDKFEKEFKKWLNCILTPPADLDSNTDQKIDVGKAWLENRNKEVPAAPTKEQVCSTYHNSHRLASLRRAARALLMGPEIAQVFLKLNVQIEKKLIAIRNDRNLHLDVGLQKIIMELLLSYNPLWLRIGLEAIYGVVLPLKSNNDIEGLTTFIVQRMFKNPHLKNKHSKSSAPNMLLPAYMEAIKKFTLKKFFMLVFFLDQAKQRKLIPHDPCLFCRNALCKESREIIIRFTRELIAGIGDITKHLRPLGYVVCHKQSYLDEYKYAVHNLAIDIRDGVRLTKVMEIIMMKNGLLNQLRTPAISRLQKIHNVQVAFNALKEANFVIIGDISANDIADGHREKTLSLLWQIIHVFRAPLFVNAANLIQTWWRKKYEVILQKRKEEELLLQKQNDAAAAIQSWWRRIQYNRLVEWKMQQITSATMILQKYCRMWLCRTRLRKFKTSVVKIETWYRSVRMIKEAKQMLITLKLEKEALRRKSAIILQSYVRRWICVKQYQIKIKQIVLIQSLVRRYLCTKHYINVRNYIVYVQRKYKGKLQMKSEMHVLKVKRKCAITIQSFYRMTKQRKIFRNLKYATRVIEEHYIALLRMRKERNNYLKIRKSAVVLQALYRGRKCRLQYGKQISSIVKLQRKIRANQLMKKEKSNFLKVKQATMIIQTYLKSYIVMKKTRNEYATLRESTILIQRHFRSYLITKSQRDSYVQLRNAVIAIQKHYRCMMMMRKERLGFTTLKNAAICIQRRYRAQVLMWQCKQRYNNIRAACITIQQGFRSNKCMLQQKSQYNKLKQSCKIIQNAYRAYKLGKQQRLDFLKQRDAALKIQRWFRNSRKVKQVMKEFQQSKHACVTIQRIYRAYVVGRKQRQEFIRVRTATLRIQTYYRSYIEMKTVRQQYIQLKTSTVTIQRCYRSHIEAKKQRKVFLDIKSAALFIQNYFRRYKASKIMRQKFCDLRTASICIQQKYRSKRAMRLAQEQYLKLRKYALIVQARYRALLYMRKERQSYLKLHKAALVLQSRYRAQRLMRLERNNYLALIKANVTIQRFYRAHVAGCKQRSQYLALKRSAIILQQRYKALVSVRKQRQIYIKIRLAIINIQRKFRAHSLMLKERAKYINIKQASITIQRMYRAHVLAKKKRTEYLMLKSTTIAIQRRFRSIRAMKRTRNQYQQLKKAIILIQHRFRARHAARVIRENEAANKIQKWYISVQTRNLCRSEYLKLKSSVIIIQSTVRMLIVRRDFIKITQAVLNIQRYYRSYKVTLSSRQNYLRVRHSIVKLQAFAKGYIARRRYKCICKAVIVIQAAYRSMKQREITRAIRERAAICIQRNFRRYVVRSRYLDYRKKVILLQKLWRGKLVTRLMRCEFLQKRLLIVKVQAIIRGYLVRRQVQFRREHLQQIKEEIRRNWAASRIQALYRGHKVRTHVAGDKRVAELRRRWREGALNSSQQTLKERNEDAMEVLSHMSSIETVIRAFKSLELLTEVFPMMYHHNASSIVTRVYIYMSVTNRSISSIEVLKYAASVLVNLTRYKITGPKIYSRDCIPPILKFMWRFSNSETYLFCILSTYLWLFAKYDVVREDLAEFLHIPENHKMLVTIKGNVERTKRMASNVRSKFSTPQTSKFISHTGNQSLNYSICNNSSNCSIPLPALEPDYGISRADKPRYFEDPQHAVNCLFSAYKL